MKTTIEVELQPFQVPNFVLVKAKPGKREEGLIETPKYRLSDISAEALDRLCNQFRREVFEKAGKQAPAREYMG